MWELYIINHVIFNYYINTTYNLIVKVCLFGRLFRFHATTTERFICVPNLDAIWHTDKPYPGLHSGHIL